MSSISDFDSLYSYITNRLNITFHLRLTDPMFELRSLFDKYHIPHDDDWCLNDFLNVDVTNIIVFPLLIYFVLDNNIEMIKTLLRYGYNINVKDYSGKTSLMIACERINIELVKLLLNPPYGEPAGINLQDEQGRTALMIACENGDDTIKIVELLLNPPYGEPADVDLQCRCGWTALMHACEDGNPKIVKLLLNNLYGKSADVNIQNIYGETALMKATEQTLHCIEIVKLLLNPTNPSDRGVKLSDINQQDKYGWTTLMYAIINNNIEMVQFLLDTHFEEQINVNIQTVNGNTALMLACGLNNIKIVDLLLDFQYGEAVNINLKNNEGKTALTFAIEENNEVIIDHLLNS